MSQAGIEESKKLPLLWALQTLWSTVEFPNLGGIELLVYYFINVLLFKIGVRYQINETPFPGMETNPSPLFLPSIIHFISIPYLQLRKRFL